MQGNKKKILNHLDKEMRFITISVGDLMAYSSPFVVGTFCDSLFVIPACGTVIVFGLKKFTRRFPKFYLFRSLYWYIPTKRFNKLLKLSFPVSHIRFWVT